VSWIRVDVTTGEQEQYDVDAEDLRLVMEIGKELKEEQSTGLKVEEKDCEGEDCDDHVRRLYIFSPDTRSQVYANYAPAWHAGRVAINSGGHCSGTLVGPKHVLTAGHCVHSGPGGSWMWSTFYPRQTSASLPTAFYAVNMWTYTAWASNGNWDYDIAIIILDRETGLGWTSFGWNNGINGAWALHNVGYPGDKPTGTQWSIMNSYCWQCNALNIRFNTLDVIPGQSGSALYGSNLIIYGDCSHQVCTWVGSTCVPYYNSFTRIDSARFSTLCSWIADSRVC